jgi:hypothetical protein
MRQEIHILPSGKKIKPLSTSLAIVLVLLLSLVMFLNGYAFAGWCFSFDYAHEFMELLYLPVYTAIIFLPALLMLSFFLVKKDSEYWKKKIFRVYTDLFINLCLFFVQAVCLCLFFLWPSYITHLQFRKSLLKFLTRDGIMSGITRRAREEIGLELILLLPRAASNV